MKNRTEIFKEKQQAMSDSELIELVQKEISKLAKTGGKSHTMCVPPMITDTDMLLSEMVRRFKERVQAELLSLPQANELSPHVRSSLPDFLYEDEGEIKVGVHGDSSVTDEWNRWKDER